MIMLTIYGTGQTVIDDKLTASSDGVLQGFNDALKQFHQGDQCAFQGEYDLGDAYTLHILLLRVGEVGDYAIEIDLLLTLPDGNSLDLEFELDVAGVETEDATTPHTLH